MSEHAISAATLIVIMVFGLTTCISIESQRQGCRDRGGQPIADRFYAVACVPKATP